MARYMHSFEKKMFRATITQEYGDGKAYSWHYGPYSTRGVAAAQITRVKKQNPDLRGEIQVVENPDWLKSPCPHCHA